MTYIEGFVIPVRVAEKEAYRRHAAAVAPLFRGYGAQRLMQCWGDDVPEGKVTDFRRAVDAKAEEAVLFSWMEFASRPARDAAIAESSADPRMPEISAAAPLDGARMIFGGFEIVSDVAGGGDGGTGFVDGVLVAVPSDCKAAYLDFARKVAAVFVDHGATRVVDAWEDDVPDGERTDFRRAVKAERDEAVIYSWIEWPSKRARDAAWDKAMADPRMKDLSMPFDGKRMVYGGFAPLPED